MLHRSILTTAALAAALLATACAPVFAPGETVAFTATAPNQAASIQLTSVVPTTAR